MKPIPLSALLVFIATLILISVAFSEPGFMAPGNGPGPRGDQFANVLHRYDEDHDGALNIAEREAMRADFRKLMGRNSWYLSKYDKDGNGTLDDAEWALAQNTGGKFSVVREKR